MRNKIAAGRRSTMSTSSTTEAIDKALQHFGVQPVRGGAPSALDVLVEKDHQIDVEKLRRGVLVVTASARHSTYVPGAPSRGVSLNMRRAPTLWQAAPTSL